MNQSKSKLLMLRLNKLDARYVNLDGDTMTDDLIIEGMVRIQDTWHAYGGFQNEDETITISGVNTWTHITNGTNDLWNGLEADGLTLSNDIMTFSNAGDYVGSLSISISALTGKDYEIRLYNVTQTTQMGYIIGGSTTGANNYINITLPLYIEANASDQMKMEIRNITDATDVTVRSAVFYLNYLHD